MDRALVEIMLTASMLCIMAVTVTAASTQYAALASTMVNASSEELHYSAIQAIFDAASESASAGSPVSYVLLLPSKIAINASGNSISTTCLGTERAFTCSLNVTGAGFSEAFNITGTPGGFVTISAFGH